MTSLYIHIPFCRRKCRYCSFAVFVSQEKWIEPYLTALEKEAAAHRGESLRTVYIGGGTPSLLDSRHIQRLSKIIRQNFDVSSAVEWSLEVNPEDVDAARLAAVAEAGFKRISLGVQSFEEKYLKAFGRCHNAAKALEAFWNLRKAGFLNINLDLLFGFPGQTEDEFHRDLESLLSLKSEHVSLYSLTIEPMSRFYAQQIKGLGMEKQAAYYETITTRLEAAGLRQYEVSNFARSGFESLHNLNYWQGGNYIGLGVAAHSHNEGRRSWNVSDLKRYLKDVTAKGSALDGEETLTAQQRFREALVFGLRMNSGVSLVSLEQKFGVRCDDELKARIQNLTDGALLKEEKGLIQATSRGRLVLDEVAIQLI